MDEKIKNGELDATQKPTVESSTESAFKEAYNNKQTLKQNKKLAKKKSKKKKSAFEKVLDEKKSVDIPDKKINRVKPDPNEGLSVEQVIERINKGFVVRR